MKSEWHTEQAFNVIRQRMIDKMELVADFVEGTAKELCPVDLGNLRNSINHIVVIEDSGMTIIAKIGTPVEYGPYLEFGTGEYAENGEGRKGGWFFFSSVKIDKLQAFKETSGGYVYFTWGSYPQPFLRPALLENKTQIKKFLNAK